jgi:hypothetical protein
MHDAHPDPNTVIDTKMEVEYLNVWQKLPCLNSVVLKNPADLPLSDKIYNVISAKKVIIDMQSKPSSGYHIANNRFLKIIANDTVLINGIEVSPVDGRFEVEITNKDLCADAFDFKNLKVNRRSSKEMINPNIKPSFEQKDKLKTDLSIFNSNGDVAIFGLNKNDILDVKVFDILGRLIALEIKYDALKTINIRLSTAQDGSIYFINIIDKKGIQHTTKFYYNEQN